MCGEVRARDHLEATTCTCHHASVLFSSTIQLSFLLDGPGQRRAHVHESKSRYSLAGRLGQVARVHSCVESCACCCCTPHFGPVSHGGGAFFFCRTADRTADMPYLTVQPSNVVTRRGHHGRATMHLADSRHFRHEPWSISAHQNNASLSREVTTRGPPHPRLGRSRPAAKASDSVKETVVKRKVSYAALARDL